MLQQLLHDVGRQVADMIGHRYHYKVVFDYVIAMLVEYKTCLTCQAKQVHAGVVQLSGIHPVVVCGILKIDVHIVLVLRQNYTLFCI